ncbi:uncharacterized protein LOC133205920 [Saccostrea echinata]|uniref:uncharacterized protein LOC133205920 n=1 Tax=Saccostrea echinata TaxID=191078 RepID=UPI002A7ED118|nr:uncharacterized protein LOC133205920 [Saccostrea echinata]
MAGAAVILAIFIVVLAKAEYMVSAVGNSADVPYDVGEHCVCSGVSCSCCRNLTLKAFQTKHYVCSKIQYDKTKQVFATKLEIDAKTAIEQDVPVNSSEPVCKEVQFGNNKTNVCFHFRHVNVSGDSVSGCVRTTIKAGEMKQMVNLGCFKLSVTYKLASHLKLHRLVRIWQKEILVRLFHVGIKNEKKKAKHIFDY